MAIDGVDYQVMRSETTTRTESSFDLVDATTALACASGTVRLPVQLKRELGRLWDDLSKAPYKELFNAGVPGLYVWRCVQVQRRIDRGIESYLKRGGTWKRYPIATHGNRLIAALAFESLPVAKFRDPAFDMTTVLDDQHVIQLVDSRLNALAEQVERHYPNSIIPTLFKNLKKCEHLAGAVRASV